jgi:hypothetical protein
MSAAQEVTVSIVSDEELAATFKDGNGESVTVQKIVSATPGPLASHFDMDGLLEMASFVHGSDQLRRRYPTEIHALGWTLYSQSPQNSGTKNASETSVDYVVSKVLSEVSKKKKTSKKKRSKKKRSKRRKRTSRKKRSRTRS